MSRPEAGDTVTVGDNRGEVLRATVGPEGQPFAIVDFGRDTMAVHNNQIDEIAKAPHNER